MTVVRRPRGLRLATPLVATLLLLSGCGERSSGTAEEDPTSPSPSSAEPTEPTESSESESADAGEEPELTTPACSEVWVAGQPFPRRYSGCYDEDQVRWVQAMVYRCSSGQHLVTYRRTFYAVKGEQVVETDVPLARDPQFTKALKTCGA